MIAVLDRKPVQQVRIAIPDSAALQLARSTVRREISQTRAGEVLCGRSVGVADSGYPDLLFCGNC